MQSARRRLRALPLIGWSAAALAPSGPGGSGGAVAQSAPPSFFNLPTNTVIGAVVVFILGVVFGETLKALLKKLGHWLEGAFSRIAPLRTRRYLRALGEDHQWLKLIGVSNRVDLHPPRLREVYISLRLAASREEEAKRVGWEQVLGNADNERRVVFLGSPGAGKSTLLDYLVLVFTSHIAHSTRKALGNPLPLYGRLRQLGAPERATIPELLARSSPVELPPDFVEHRLRKGGCLVLLDGLDEVLDEAQQARVLEEIRRLSHLSPRNWIVLTCRVAGWQTNWLPGFRVFEVQELERDDIRQFIGAWYREVLRTEKVNALGVRLTPEQTQAAERLAYTEAQEKVAELWGALEKNDGLLRLAATPLLLSLMALVHYRRAKLPEERGTLFADCLQILLEIWDEREKGLKVQGGCSAKQTRRALQELAFHFLLEGKVEAELAELELALVSLAAELPSGFAITTLVRQIEERSGILVEQSLGRYSFAHRALHDFLAAEHIAAHELDDLLVERVAEERWREVILIAAGKVSRPRAERLLRALLDDEGGGTEALEVAGRCLAEEIQVGPDLRAEVRRKLIERLEREEAGGSWARLVEALRVSDTEGLQRWLGEQLRGGTGDTLSKLLLVARGLSEEDGRPLVPTLIRLLEDGTRQENERVDAALALSRWPGLGADSSVLGALRAARVGNQLRLRRAAHWAWCELGHFADEDLNLVKVPAGEFLMGSREGEGDADECPQHTLYLPTFYIGRDPVTVSGFRRFLEASGHGFVGPLPMGKERHPVGGVSWRDALAYAEHFGGTLPSEAEWEKAARGTDGRTWPWGDDWDKRRANTREVKRRGTSEVGAFSPQGDSPYGCRDMAGNVREWTRSLWGNDLGRPQFGYPYQPGGDREELAASAEVLRVVRGGAFHDTSMFVRCAYRNWIYPVFRSVDIGFRVVLSPFLL